jgi:hypothetical protein
MLKVMIHDGGDSGNLPWTVDTYWEGLDWESSGETNES